MSLAFLSTARARRLGLCTLALLSLSACEDAEDDPQGEVPDQSPPPVGARCALDEDERPEEATPLRLGEEARGALCPIGDEDWYRVEIPKVGLLSVSLQMESDYSPASPTWSLWSTEGGALGEQLISAGAPNESNRPRCVSPGERLLKVSERGADAEDKREGYLLELSLRDEPDSTEPTNNSPPGATPLTEGMPAEGWIACAGDVDWFALEIGAGQLLSLSLEAPAGLRHVVSLWRRDAAGEPEEAPFFRLSSDRPNVEGERLERTEPFEEGGQFFVSVEAAAGGASPDTPYQLLYTRQAETDENEPNDLPGEGTALPTLRCDARWSPWGEAGGVVGRLGDQDWFLLNFEGCDRGLFEARIELDDAEMSREEAFLFQERFQLSAALLKVHEGSPCTLAEPERCRSLAQPCTENWDCRGLGNACGSLGYCAGVSTCAPLESAPAPFDGFCAAQQLERRARRPEGSTPMALPPQRVILSAPLYRPGQLYLRINDFGGDQADPRARYRVQVRARQDPDLHEPSNLYTDELRSSDPVGGHLSLAREKLWVTVMDNSAGHVAPPRESMGEEKGGEALDQSPPDHALQDQSSSDLSPQDAGPLDGALPDMSPPDSALPDMSPPDSALPDMSPPDSALPDMSSLDSALPDMHAGDLGVERPREPVGPDVPRLQPGSCADPAAWVSGAISYEDDQDFYAYRHPCPGEDCMVKIFYEVDEGPVDLLWQIYSGDELWWSPLLPVSELEISAGMSGAYGGIEANDECFYAYQGHGEVYHLSIRDFREKIDWSSEQRYRFCIEKSGQGCFLNCDYFGEEFSRGRGCAAPRESR